MHVAVRFDHDVNDGYDLDKLESALTEGSETEVSIQRVASRVVQHTESELIRWPLLWHKSKCEHL